MNLTSEIATSLVRVRFTTDNMPGDNRWDITDGAGDVVASTAFGDMTENQTEYEWWVNLGATGCYNFTVYDQLETVATLNATSVPSTKMASTSTPSSRSTTTATGRP